MSLASLLFLNFWTACGLLWWLLALGLIAATKKTGARPRSSVSTTPAGISIFKPLPHPRSHLERDRILTALTTFANQLDSHTEMLLGVEPRSAQEWDAALAPLIQLRPSQIRYVRLPTLADYSNRKIAKMEVLAPEARKEYWLWSDADIAAPPDFLEQARSDLAKLPSGMMTYPYRIRHATQCPEWMDAFFVNAELLPGVLLLSRLGPVPFALGAAMLFPAAAFREKIAWPQLGATMADDYFLGGQLGPCHVGQAMVETFPDASEWRGALVHLHRWRAAIRWCRPGGFAAQILVMPVLGWLVAVALHPSDPVAWWGCLFAVQMDAFAALLASTLLGGTASLSSVMAAQVWGWVRSLSWFATWLPIPLHWRDRRWKRGTAKSQTRLD
jgi:ceramide glucosyltransferase